MNIMPDVRVMPLREKHTGSGGGFPAMGADHMRPAPGRFRPFDQRPIRILPLDTPVSRGEFGP